MKKFFALLLALAMVLSLAACGAKAPVETQAPETTEAPAVPDTYTYNSSLSTFPELFCIFPRQLEAASSAACVVVVRCRVVNVEIHRRSQSQHTGALGPWRGRPFNDRPSQGKVPECRAQAIINSVSKRRPGDGRTHKRMILTKILNSRCL